MVQRPLLHGSRRASVDEPDTSWCVEKPRILEAGKLRPLSSSPVPVAIQAVAFFSQFNKNKAWFSSPPARCRTAIFQGGSALSTSIGDDFAESDETLRAGAQPSSRRSRSKFENARNGANRFQRSVAKAQPFRKRIALSRRESSARVVENNLLSLVEGFDLCQRLAGGGSLRLEAYITLNFWIPSSLSSTPRPGASGTET